MKNITLNILKKNRVYFACTTESGFKVKLKIDENSKDLELGTHDLLVDDISVRTKYGTDVIYALHSSIQEQESAGICTLAHYAYNSELVEKCRNLGGRWDADAKAWIFSDVVQAQVEQLDEEYNEDLADYKITFLQDDHVTCGSYDILGYKIAQAWSRDSGAKWNLDVVKVLKGTCTSGGSMKNWKTIVSGSTEILIKLSKDNAEYIKSNFSEDLKIEKI